MIEINLLPLKHRPKVAPKFVVPEIPIRRTLLTIGGFVFGAQVLISLFALYQVAEISYVKNKTAGLVMQAAGVTRQKAEITAGIDRLGKINSLTERKFTWASLLNSLSHCVTKGVWLTGVSLSESKAGDVKNATVAAKTLRIDGSVVGAGEETASIGKFIKALKSNAVFSGLFSSIELSNMVQKKIREFDVYDFSIYCTFKPEKGDSK